MKQLLFLAVPTFILLTVPTSQACKGCVSLDEYNFDKIISRFKAVLVKFDIAFPYGDKHETFSKLADEVTKNKDILFAEVGIKDYGDKENEELGKKYGVKTKEQLPVVKLFVQGKPDPVTFPASSEWTVDNLRNLIRDNTDIYIGLPGCIEKYDKHAMNFVTAPDKSKKLKEFEQLTKSESEDEKLIAKTYSIFMKKIIEQGIEFVKQEAARLAKIIKEGKINEKKKEELSYRLNILHSFTIPVKDEL